MTMHDRGGWLQVGAGKSSLLAALLGELQPVAGAGHVPGQHIRGAPVVCGLVALCQQVPWIEAGTVRANIVFGAPYEPAWCAAHFTLRLHHASASGHVLSSFEQFHLTVPDCSTGNVAGTPR